MKSVEEILFWLTILLLAITFFLTILSAVMKRTSILKTPAYTVLAGFICLTLHGLLRWVASGHPPFVTLFESMTLSVWFVLLTYLILQYSTGRYSILLIPVSLISFLLMGWASSLPTEASPLSAALDNVWLFIHASFATTGAASFLIASSFSTLYLFGEEKFGQLSKTNGKLPEYKSLPTSILNFVLLGLILWGVMIVSGSIWAHIAWGRYWAWDPIELWSLISWLLFALVLHSRLGFKVSHKNFSRFTIIAALTVIFSLWGVGYIYKTIHTYG